MSDAYEIKAFKKVPNKYGKLMSNQMTIHMKAADTFETMLDKAVMMMKSDRYSDVFLYRVKKVYELVPVRYGFHAEEKQPQCPSR